MNGIGAYERTCAPQTRYAPPEPVVLSVMPPECAWLYEMVSALRGNSLRSDGVPLTRTFPRRVSSRLPRARATLGSRALMKAKVIVMPKLSVLDPQGVAVRDAIHHHGLPAAKSVRVGKFIEIELDGSQTEAQLHEVCRDLLSNPVIEDYVLSVEG